jgi:6-phosphogluconolactonase
VTQVDERWVPEDHPDSNARLIRSQLLHGAAAGARFISMKTAAAEAFDAEAQASQALAAFRDGIDVTVLGMGSDGHTASFFPGASTLSRALDPKGEALCVAVRPPVAPHDRMTLSLAGLLRSRHLYLHISGAEKRQVLDQALAGGPVEALPIRAVLFQSQPELHVYYEPGS